MPGVRRDRGIRLIQVAVDIRGAGDCDRGRAIREVVDVLGADDMDFGESCWR